MVQESAPQGSALSRAFLAEFLRTAPNHPDALTAFQALMEPDCRIHLQNGDVVGPEESQLHTLTTQAVLPDLEMQVDHALFPDERLAVQLRFTGSVAPGFPVVVAGQRVTALSAVVGRVTPGLRLGEVWAYINPGFPLSFPPQGFAQQPPPEDGAGPAEARALYERWVRDAEERGDFVSAVASSLAPNGVVHIGNGDVGRVDALHGVFAQILRGLPDLTIGIDDVVTAGDRVIVQFSMSGTHQGQLGFYPPTGKVLPSRGMFIARANRAAEAAEVWVYVAPGYAVGLPPRNPEAPR